MSSPHPTGGWPARLAIARRDLLEFIRDRRALFITLVMPMAMYPLLALSSTLGIRTAIFELDRRAESQRLDFVFSGTNAEEATSASYSFLKYLQKRENVDFILTTHFVKLCRKVKKTKNMRIDNYKMSAELVGDNILFSYKLVKGISKIKAAKLILMQMGFPKEIYE